MLCFIRSSLTHVIHDLLRVEVKDVCKAKLNGMSHVAASSFPAPSGGLIPGDIMS